MFLKANYSSIPAYKDIPQIASEDIRNHLPARFDGQDKDLLDAEASIDPLVNNAPPTPSGIDINWDMRRAASCFVFCFVLLLRSCNIKITTIESIVF